MRCRIMIHSILNEFSSKRKRATVTASMTTGKPQHEHEQLTSKENKEGHQKADDCSSKDCGCIIYNFRLAAGLKGIYRCGMTDGLASVVVAGSSKKGDKKVGGSQSQSQPLLVLLEPECILLQEATPVLDLRDVDERDEAATQMWTSQAPGGPLPVH